MSIIRIKQSSVPNDIPTINDLELGEIAINVYDGKIYIKKNDGVESVVSFEPGIGYAGSQGNVGYTGSVGDIGYTGSFGYTGSIGDIGYSGSQGVIGYTGSFGYTGSMGYTGSVGAGYTGSGGDTGFTGSIGYTGSKGDVGYTGSIGDIGYTGSLGYTGSIGYTGSSGTIANLTVSQGGTGRTSFTANALLIGNGVGAISEVPIGSSNQVLFVNGTQWGTGNVQALLAPRLSNNGATTSGNITPNFDSIEQYDITGLTGTVTIKKPSGGATHGVHKTILIKDNGVARTLSWETGVSGGYRAINVTLPTTTVAGKVLYIGCKYNSTDSRWDVVAAAQEA